MFPNFLTPQQTITNWKDFCDEVVDIFEEVKKMPNDGKNASYIPILATADPEWFGVSICTVSNYEAESQRERKSTLLLNVQFF